jgi:hypothetical protein
MNRLRKIGNHFRRHRGKYIVSVAAILIVVLYAQKKESEKLTKELLDDIFELDRFVGDNVDVQYALKEWRNS